LILLGSFDIDIPAGESDYVVTDEYELPVDVEVLSVYPHAHYLGKELQGFARLPNGKREWLIRILDWDFNWQDDYRYAKPIHLPAGAVLTMRYSYDNSSDNPQNPSRPPQRVVFGAKSTDEMAEMAIQVLPRNDRDLELLNRDLSRKYNLEIVYYRASQEYQLANQLAEQGRLTEAADHYRAALNNRSDDPRVFVGLASVLVKLDEIDGAVLVAEQAARLTEQNDPSVMSLLASAYAAAGRMADAIRTAERAHVLAEAAGLADLATELRLRVERYRRGGGR
jgi:tetratricopeptide (TPR) repeat protein